MQKIRVFIDKYVAENNLTTKDSKALLEFLTTSLNQKKLSKTKDVVYDKSTGLIKSIPCLLFNQTQRKFTLKRIEKRQTTMRVVGAKRVAANKTRDHKTSKLHRVQIVQHIQGILQIIIATTRVSHWLLQVSK